MANKAQEAEYLISLYRAFTDKPESSTRYNAEVMKALGEANPNSVKIMMFNAFVAGFDMGTEIEEKRQRFLAIQKELKANTDKK